MRHLFVFLVVLAPVLCIGAVPDFASVRSAAAFRVAPSYEQVGASHRTFLGQSILAGPKRLPEATISAMAQELARSYATNRPATRCAFVARYGLRLRLAHGTTEVLFCPHCSEAEFVTGKRMRRTSLDGVLLRRLIALFPDYPLRANEA